MPNPIIYSPPMVLANLAGIKSQTRRIRGVEMSKINNSLHLNWQITQSIVSTHAFKNPRQVFTATAPDRWSICLSCPYGQVGDVLYGRERLYRNPETDEWHYFADKAPVVVDKADEFKAISWAFCKEVDYCPSIHMPKFAARLWQEITAVRLERLHEITEADAIAEGCIMGADGFPVEQPHKSGIGEVGWDDAKEWYSWLWEEINGADSWEVNPFVWVIEYKTVTKPRRGVTNVEA